MVEDDKLLILKKMLSKMNWGGEGGGEECLSRLTAPVVCKWCCMHNFFSQQNL